MASSFEKSVKGGTKIKLAAPKSKYVEHILVATRAGDAGVAEIFRTLTNRLRDSTWTIVFKALIIVHLMIREGEPNITLKFLADSPSKLAISNFSDVQVQGGNIRHYYNYILARATAFRDTKLDWVREGQGRLKRQSVDKGLLRETESVQKQIAALLKCDLLSNEPENEITLTAFRLLTMDLLSLYAVMNEGTINILEHYFEMSKFDAERALSIYKNFSRKTEEVVKFLSMARQYESATRLEIPKLKHAPTSLTASLEEYVNDPDFEVNRRQYLAAAEAKKSGNPIRKPDRDNGEGSSKTNPISPSAGGFPKAQPVSQAPAQAQSQSKGPAPDLIDFFESIEQNQQPMATQSQQQFSSLQNNTQYQFQHQPVSTQQPYQTGLGQPQQQTNGSYANSNPFAQMSSPQQNQVNFTGAGFGGYSSLQEPYNSNQNAFQNGLQDQSATFSPQQQQVQNMPFSPQQQQALQQTSPFSPQQQSVFSPGQLQTSPTGQQQSTNPFRQSMMLPTPSSATSSFPGTPQSTNPFARNLPAQQSGPQSAPLFSASQYSMAVGQDSPTAQQLQPSRTGTNPFARSAPVSQFQTPITSPVTSNVTGSTNPFRQSTFINPQTGQGWQASQGTIGGLEQLPTIPVFPRPVGPQPVQQQQPW